MKNEELKERLISVLQEGAALGGINRTTSYDEEQENGVLVRITQTYTEVEIDFGVFADALIAAGLRFGENLTATFDRMALEREHELERRLSEAEYWKSVYDLALNIAFTGEERAYYLKRAEEKLKEGSRKDEQTCKIFAVGGKSDT